MKVRDLRLVLSSQVPSLSAEELAELNELLSPADELTISELCAVTTVKLRKPKRAPAKSKLNETLVADYVSELNAQSSNDVLKAVIERLKKDKGIKVAEARAVAAQLVGERTYKTKADAIKAIEQRRLADARASHRLSHIGEIF